MSTPETKEHTVDTIDALLKMYKHNRFEGRGQEYMDACIAAHTERLKEYGVTQVTRHDSKSGETVYLFAKRKITILEAYELLPLAEKTLVRRRNYYEQLTGFRISNDRGISTEWWLYKDNRPVALVVYYRGRRLVMHGYNELGRLGKHTRLSERS